MACHATAVVLSALALPPLAVSLPPAASPPVALLPPRVVALPPLVEHRTHPGGPATEAQPSLVERCRSEQTRLHQSPCSSRQDCRIVTIAFEKTSHFV